MCLAQGPQRSAAGKARTRGLSVLSQALYHWATALSDAYLLPKMSSLIDILVSDTHFACLPKYLIAGIQNGKE